MKPLKNGTLLLTPNIIDACIGASSTMIADSLNLIFETIVQT